MWFGTWSNGSLYKAGLLMTVAKEISEYKLNLVGVQEVRWERWQPNQKVNTHFSIERRVRIMNWVLFFVHVSS
jgi:hypothetical protein